MPIWLHFFNKDEGRTIVIDLRKAGIKEIARILLNIIRRKQVSIDVSDKKMFDKLRANKDTITP